MRAYIFFDRILKKTDYAFLVSSVFITISELLLLLCSMYDGLNSALPVTQLTEILHSMVAYIFAYFISVNSVKGNKSLKTLWIVLCLLVLSTVGSFKLSVFFAVLLSLCFIYLLNIIDMKISLPLVFTLSVMMGVLLNFVGDYLNNVQINIATAVSNKGILTTVLFAIISGVMSLLGNNSFTDLFFFKSFGGTIIDGENVITGIKDMVSHGFNGKVISSLMSGHYFVLFAFVGIALCLYDELKSKKKITLLAVLICTIATGDMELIMIYLLFECWHLLLSLFFLFSLSYVSAALLDIRVPYMLNGGIFEMFININKPVYLVMGGIVFIAMGYFVSKYSVLKYGISDYVNIYIPDRLKQLVFYLGGIVNIIKVSDGNVEVRNPKLVNNLMLDCEIKENIVRVNDIDISDLSEYVNKK